MQERDDCEFPDQSASPDENTDSVNPKKTIAARRKSVGVIEADPARLKALEYLGRRWLSHR
ncbi:hypothetical protein [Sinorhizobium medicae]|uniref:hypothetical protein n=1 Tax=Sinorhizobium medicae TaxID=110321 RepID=UPI0011A61333